MSLTREAFDRIRDAIISGRLDFGEPLSETQVARALGMSKAPVRAALIELKDKGLVNIVPQAGTYVFSPTADDIMTLSSFRALLENAAVHEAMAARPKALLARLDEAIAKMTHAVAVRKWEIYNAADTAYHHAFLQEADNPYLLKAYQLVDGALEATRVRFHGNAGIRERSYDEHIEIATLLRSGNMAKATKLLREHILRITELRHPLPSVQNKASRKDYSSIRNYFEVFNPSSRGRERATGNAPGRKALRDKSADRPKSPRGTGAQAK
jgi:DNA-binding GntR family transcriptional regulator